MVSAIGYFNHLLGGVSRVRLAPVIMFVGIAVAAWGQYILLSDRTSVLRGAIFMAVGGLAFLTALLVEWQSLSAKAVLDQDREESGAAAFPWGLRQQLGLVVGILGGLAGFFLNDNSTFTTWGFSLWLAGLVGLVLAFWPSPGRVGLRLPKLDPSSAWVMVVLVFTLALAAFLRFYHLDSLLKEMVSDHPVPIENIKRIRDGGYPIYLLVQDGQEPLFSYVGAGVSFFFGYSFLTIKVASAIVGVLTVAATYFMTRELFGNQRVALIAAMLMSLSFWHIVVSRIGFGYGLWSLTVALTLAFLFRALKYNRSSDFVFAGLFLGLGLYTYSGARVVPLAVGLILIISLLSRLLDRRSEWPTFFLNSTILILAALVVYAPLGRFALDYPELYWRQASGAGGGPIWELLGDNLQRTLLLFNSGQSYLGFAPLQLDYLTAAAFVLGLGTMAVLWLRGRRGLNAYAVLALLVMLIPSIWTTLSNFHDLSAGRTAGAIPLVFAAAALPFYIGTEFLVKAFGRVALVPGLAFLGVALGLIGFVNLHSYFDEYAAFWGSISRNDSEFGAVFRDFEERGGDFDNAWVWNVGPPGNILQVEIGDLDYRNGIEDIEELKGHALSPEAKLYVLSLEDGPTVLRLREIYPRGSSYKFESSRSEPGTDFGFFVFLVPAEGEAPMTPLPNTHLIR